MVMADSIDQSLQTLRSQLNLVNFNLRTESPSEEKYERVLEMLRNLQYLRITVNRPASTNAEGLLFSPLIYNTRHFSTFFYNKSHWISFCTGESDGN